MLIVVEYLLIEFAAIAIAGANYFIDHELLTFRSSHFFDEHLIRFSSRSLERKFNLS